MSKMDNLRAMREAKYAAGQKRAAGAPTKPAAAKAPVAPPVTAPQATLKEKAKVDDEVVFGTDSDAGEALCGHRNMSGRTCTREQGHSAKSHRYS